MDGYVPAVIMGLCCHRTVGFAGSVQKPALDAIAI